MWNTQIHVKQPGKANGRHKKLQFKDDKEYNWEKFTIKKAKNNLAQGRQKITSIIDSNEQEIADQDERVKRIEEFDKQLYDSDTQTEEQENQMNQYQMSQIGRWNIP